MSATYHRLQPRDNPALLSIVLPAYNESEVLPLLRERMRAFIAQLPCPVEVIVVNDGSRDDTLDQLFAWAQEDAQIRVLGLARNFGHQIAATAGLDAARGDAVVIMDADLQDPPEVVLEMLEKYRAGYDVVYGQRASRDGESKFKLFTAWAFYRLMRSFVHRDLPADTGDFRLMSRACLDALKQMREVHRFLRGMVTWVGFAQTAVKYHRPVRAAGETKYPLRKMLLFAWTAAISFSTTPLRLSIYAGAAAALFGVGYGVFAVIRVLMSAYFDTPPISGWASVIVLNAILSGAILMSIGVLGEYVGRIFEEIKDRPLYIVSQRYNFAEPTTPTGEPLTRVASRSNPDATHAQTPRDERQT